VKIAHRRIASISVIRGASCGATWEVVERLIGTPVEEVLSRIGREVQYLCLADPSAFDPVSGKSALHFAGKVHMQALAKAIETAAEKRRKGSE